MQKVKAQATRVRKKPSSMMPAALIASPRYIIGGLAFVFTIGIFASIPKQGSSLNNPSQTKSAVAPLELDLTNSAINEQQALAEPKPVIEEVQPGDSMSTLFLRAGIGSSIVHMLAYESEHGDDFSDIRPGKHFEFVFNADNKVSRIDYVLSPLERYTAQRTDTGFETSHHLTSPDVVPVRTIGTITSSFYNAGQRAGLTDGLIMELANIFGWDIDFVYEIREQDQFSVVYEEHYLNGEKLGNGNILAAEFINRDKSYKAVRYEDSNGRSAFYTPEGESMRKAFLRTPLDVFRISSHFNPNRKHPVLNTIRAHNGTDYAAARGTPIKASGSGRIIYASVQGGYGNVIKIQHAQSYKTVYAHMDRFAKGMGVGKTVEQGDIIGYVGSTGLATGPHLHYEFYINGAVRNPATVKLPNGTPVPQSEIDRFQALTQPVLALLQNLDTKYASQPHETNPGS